MLGLALSGSAQAPPAPPDEVTQVRVARQAGGQVRLSWQAPVDPVESYQVRRCVLPSLRASSYGNCIAEGLVATSHVDAAPAGSYFYLVSGLFSGTEGSLGSSFDGTAWTPRASPACSNPSTPGPMSIVISLPSGQVVCGTRLTIRHAPEVATFVAAACTGVTAGFFPVTNSTTPGRIIHVCASATGSSSPGDITSMDFLRGECPLDASAFRIETCEITVGMPDCSNPVPVELPCLLR